MVKRLDEHCNRGVRYDSKVLTCKCSYPNLTEHLVKIHDYNTFLEVHCQLPIFFPSFLSEDSTIIRARTETHVKITYNPRCLVRKPPILLNPCPHLVPNSLSALYYTCMRFPIWSTELIHQHFYQLLCSAPLGLLLVIIIRVVASSYIRIGSYQG